MIEPNKLQKLWINMMKTREREREREMIEASSWNLIWRGLSGYDAHGHLDLTPDYGE